MEIGSIVKKKQSDDKSLYMYLGPVQKGEQHPVVEDAMGILSVGKVQGYFTDFPLSVHNEQGFGNYSGHCVTECYIWNVDIFKVLIQHSQASLELYVKSLRDSDHLLLADVIDRVEEESGSEFLNSFVPCLSVSTKAFIEAVYYDRIKRTR